MSDISPTPPPKRHMILDSLRGFALLGICLANFQEFSLYSFLPAGAAEAMPTAAADRAVKYLLYAFVDGKFYSIFSVLFGIGFSIILRNAAQKGADGTWLFYRRMAGLALIGFAHLMFVWSGDILLLYALVGMSLPFFANLSDRKILATAAVLIALPVGMDFLRETGGGKFDPALPAVRAQEYFNSLYGINGENFHTWLRDAESYSDVMKFLVQGAFVRIREFIDGNRVFKVLGLFLTGFCIGRSGLYANLGENTPLLKKTAVLGFAAGIPLSLAYSFSAMGSKAWGITFHSALYAASVVPTALAYMAAICLLYVRFGENPVFRFFSHPGKIALTNYIGQSLFGMFIFYGIGLGLGADTGLAGAELAACGIFAAQAVFSLFWTKYFNFGPAEWIWRMFTYGKFLKIAKGAPAQSREKN